jgi:hypothetical protein
MQTELMVGLADLLAAELPGWTFDEDGPLGPLPILLEALPERQDDGIAVSAYPVDDQPGGDNFSMVGIQLMMRRAGDNPQYVRNLDDQIFGLLHSRWQFVLSTGVRVADCLRRSSASLGQDSLRRWTRSANYYVGVAWPATYRI